MAPDKPVDIICEATDTIGLLCELLDWGYSPDRSKRDLMHVDSDKLAKLLGRCEDDLRRALDMLTSAEVAETRQRVGLD